MAHRWYEAGHPPFASLYEMLLSFVWTLAALTLIAEKRYGVKVIGTVTMPVAIVGVVLMQLLRSEVRPLVPALQSTWLHVHVTLAMLAYAACALSFALAMMFLIQDKMKTETFLAATSMFTVGIYAAILTRFEKWGGLNVVAWDAENKTEVFISPRCPPVRHHPGSRLADAAGLRRRGRAARALCIWRACKNEETFLSIANRASSSASCCSRWLSSFSCCARAMDVIHRSMPRACIPRAWPPARSFCPRWSAASLPTCCTCCCCGVAKISSACLPDADALDRITYKTICIAFPLLTLMIAAGAYWANRAWGSYWNWDPKETWAAITWLVYAGYLHMRITRGWRGRRAAYFAILGFAVVMFTFFGVTYLLPGLHAYA